MGRTKRGVAAVLVACGLLGCHLRKQAVVDAGGGPEEDAEAVAEAAAPSETAAPSASAEPAAKHVGPHCETGEVAIVLAPGEETCVVECKSTSDCPPAWTCDGEGPVSHSGRPGNVIHFCKSAAHGKPADGGASAQDGGHPAHAATDAGSPAKKAEHHDGGAKSK